MLEDLKTRIQLEAMLTVLGHAMVIAHRLNREIADYALQRDGVAEIRTENSSIGRSFRISHGEVRVLRGTHPAPDYAMVYRDIPVALKVMMQGTDEASMQAMSEGELRFEGDMDFGMWFNELLKKVGKLIKNPRKIISF